MNESAEDKELILKFRKPFANLSIVSLSLSLSYHRFVFIRSISEKNEKKERRNDYASARYIAHNVKEREGREGIGEHETSDFNCE